MALAYNFNSTVESWTLDDQTNDGATFSFDGTNGSPATGCLKVVMPPGGSGGAENNVSAVNSPVISEVIATSQTASIKYRIVNNLSTRNFDVVLSLFDNVSTDLAGISTGDQSITGDSGWLTLSGNPASTGTAVDYEIQFTNTSDDVGDYDIFIDTIALADASTPFDFTHNAAGIPGSIKVA